MLALAVVLPWYFILSSHIKLLGLYPRESLYVVRRLYHLAL